MNLFFDDTATTEIYALSLHDALPIFVAYVRSCAVAFARGGVAVNAVVPGVTDTPQLEIDARAAGVSRAAIVERYAADVPLGRVGRPEDVAALTAFLLSEPAAALVGQVLSPNGGTTTATAS